jgi:hypothetical protein
MKEVRDSLQKFLNNEQTPIEFDKVILDHFDELEKEIEKTKKEKEELRGLLAKGMVRTYEDEGSLTIYWSDLRESEQDKITEILKETNNET